MDSLKQELPDDHLEYVEAWGRASGSVAHVFRPSTLAELKKTIQLAKDTGRTVGFRGGGNSYGDAFGNRENIVLDTSRLNRITNWDPEAGLITVEPGVTIEQLWRYVLADGWWPPIVTGTAKTTVGGCASMNTHGKNGFNMGTFGDHITEIEMIMANGRKKVCTRDKNSDLFFAAIGGFGMFGCLVSITIQLKKIYSGQLEVTGCSRPNLASVMSWFDENRDGSDYLVGWVDSTARGKSFGRGEMHKARYFEPGEDPAPARSLSLEAQSIPDSILGLIPKSSMWFYMGFFFNNPGMTLVNTGKYVAAKLLSGEKGKTYKQSHTAYHFLLDYVPGWKWGYGRGGLIQYQTFFPKETAENAFAELLKLNQERRMPNYLTVLKRHKPSDFLVSYSPDGYSMAMDFRITDKNREQVARMARSMDEIVVKHSGQFYFAKDSTMRPDLAEATMGKEKVAEVIRLKKKYDPKFFFQTDLWNRIFAPLAK